MEAVDLRKLSVEDYLDLEKSSDQKWEYFDGEVFAMAGASAKHNAVTMNIALALGNSLKRSGGKCFAMSSDQKIESRGGKGYFYPDISVICGKPRFGVKHRAAMANPTVLIEVLSESTGDYDRARKFDHYTTIPEFREYLVVSSEEQRIDHWKRTAENQWLVTRITSGAIQLESIDVTLTLDEVYADLDRVEP